MRIAILGVFNSGSTALAGVLHQLGVNMGGPPFFREFYEAEDIARNLRQWWSEPELVETVSREERVRFLTEWMAQKEREGFTDIAIKHPLLCLSAPDIDMAWGPEVHFVWSKRDLNESIIGLARRNWYAQPAAMQMKLWGALMEFIGTHQHITVAYVDLVRDPRQTIGTLVRDLGLSVSDGQVDQAVETAVPDTEQ